MLYKRCNKCDDLKEVDEFYKRKTSKDGYRNECKLCSNKNETKRKDKRKETRQSREVITEGEKVCRICELKKDISEFHIKRGTPDGHRNECKECVKGIKKKYDDPEKRKEYDKIRYKNNKEEILDNKKEYYQSNKEQILEQKATYRDNPENRQRNKDYIKKYKVENREKYYKYRNDNPHIIAWRSILYSTLKRLDTKKSDKTINLLGYSADELKENLISKFSPGMSWENHGDWHIDHIHPVTKFDPNTPVSEVCALSNLQPLWEFDNLSKSNKI